MTASNPNQDLAPQWFWGLFAALLMARFLGLAFAGFPVGPDEGQYWAYGQEAAFGHYSKPPLLGWLIALGEWVWGHNPLGLRFFIVVIHGLIALLLVRIAELLGVSGGRWAGLLYLTLPAVAYSSNIASTDPPMMLGWTLALYGVVRAQHRPIIGFFWAGLGCGLAMLGKYTALSIFLMVVLSWWFSVQRPKIWPGILVFLVMAFVVMAPNLYWNAQNDFASFRHVGENAALDGPLFHPDHMLEFVIAQFGIFGPLLMLALIMASWKACFGAGLPQIRLLLVWVWPLLLVIVIQSLLSRAHANWAAPVYVAASLVVAISLLQQNRRVWMQISCAFGILLTLGLPCAQVLVAQHHTQWDDRYDLAKRFRFADALAADMADVVKPNYKLLSHDRKLLSLLVYRLDHEVTQIRALTRGHPGNHYEMAYPFSVEEEGCYIFAGRHGLAPLKEFLGEHGGLIKDQWQRRYRTHKDREVLVDLAQLEIGEGQCR